MKSNDFIKYLTVTFVERMENPQKTVKRKKKDSFSNHWFGLIPLSIKMIAKRFQKNA